MEGLYYISVLKFVSIMEKEKIKQINNECQTKQYLDVCQKSVK